MAVIEYARNVCGIADANSTEFDLRAKNPVIDILPEQKKIEGLGGNMRLGGKDVDVKPDTLAFRLFDIKRRSASASATATRSIPSTSPRSKTTAWSSPAKRTGQPIMQYRRAPAGRAPVLHRYAGAS
jgi:CTP synthase